MDYKSIQRKPIKFFKELYFIELKLCLCMLTFPGLGSRLRNYSASNKGPHVMGKVSYFRGYGQEPP